MITDAVDGRTGPDEVIDRPASATDQPQPAGPGELLDRPDPPVTGDPDVDHALAALAAAVAGPPDDVLPAFDAAYQTLQDRLADVEG